jgi:hypothetical protein
MQVNFWLEQEILADETRHLYFDIANFAATLPSGTLAITAFHPPGYSCESDESLAAIPLDDLAVTSEWETRCVSFTAREPFSIFGLHVFDGTFKIGLDTFRFGPPCHD